MTQDQWESLCHWVQRAHEENRAVMPEFPAVRDIKFGGYDGAKQLQVVRYA